MGQKLRVRYLLRQHKFNVLGLRNRFFFLFKLYIVQGGSFFYLCSFFVFSKFENFHKNHNNDILMQEEKKEHSKRDGSSNPDWKKKQHRNWKNDEPTKSFTIDFKSIYMWIKYASTFKHMITQIIYVFTAYLWIFILYSIPALSSSDLNTKIHTHSQ